MNAVDGWCKTAIASLTAFLGNIENIKEKDVAEAQKVIMHDVLERGQSTITEALKSLSKCHERFNTMSGKIIALIPILTEDSKDTSEYFKRGVAELRLNMAKYTTRDAAAAAKFLGPLTGSAISLVKNGGAELYFERELRSRLAAYSESFEELRKKLDRADEVIKMAKADISKETVALSNISSDIDTTKISTNAWAKAPPQMLEFLKQSTNQLIQTCKDYRESAENKRQTQWTVVGHVCINTSNFIFCFK